MGDWRRRVSTACGWGSAVFLVAMLLLTVADVVLRGVFGYALRGVYELIELFLAATFFLALPCVFWREENIVVNSIDDHAPRWVPALKRASELLAVVVLAVMAWQGAIAARDSLEFHDVTADLGLPRTWHWSAVLVGIVAAMLAALSMALRRGSRS